MEGTAAVGVDTAVVLVPGPMGETEVPSKFLKIVTQEPSLFRSSVIVVVELVVVTTVVNDVVEVVTVVVDVVISVVVSLTIIVDIGPVTTIQEHALEIKAFWKDWKTMH